MEYRELIFKIEAFEPFGQIMIAQLADLGFDSFQEDPPLLKAYIAEESYDPNILAELEEIEGHFQLVSDQLMEKINWNEEWEKNFNPLSVGDFCHIRAPFHPEMGTFEFELVIEPKMSFGTGHHATTQNMILLMKDLGVKGASLLDLGSGTGILAILGAKMEAESIYATDIEDWAFENMQENFKRNQTKEITPILGSLPLKELNGKRFDVVLVNINRNVLIEQLPLFKELMNPNGMLLLSGFYRDDELEISGHCNTLGLSKVKEIEKDQWMAVSYQLTSIG